ncbi:MAG: hypothetical protein Q9206_005380, partial [Seirophora lacunosa]
MSAQEQYALSQTDFVSKPSQHFHQFSSVYLISMDVISGVSAPSKKLISTPNDTDIIPQPLRIHKRKRQDSIVSSRTSALTPSSPPPLKVPKRRPQRSLSNSMAQPDLLGPRSHSNPLPRGRQPSLKHRLLSLVMNRLISRPDSTRQSADIPSPPNAIDRQSSDGRVSFSTMATVPSFDTEMEDVLSAFPEPPISNRALCAPADVALVRPSITITPEIETLHPDTNQSTHIAIKIGAVPEVMTKVPHGQHYGIDMAIVIDNSPYASPATLVASCETARFLSSLLDPTNDRMAIICTSSMNTGDRDRRTILPLSLPNSRKTKAAVDSILSSTDRPSLSTLDAAIRSARALLGQSTPRDQNSALSPFAFGHIFVLTSNSRGVAPELLTHDTIQLHLICAGSVPWKGSEKVGCNGWKLQSMHSKELQSVSHLKDEDASSLFNRLRTTVVDARKGCLHGTVSDLVLEIKAGQNCAIEGVIGSRNIPSLQRGEVIVALVALKVGLPPAAGYTFSARRQLDDSSPGGVDLEKDIDTLLGTTPVTVLNVKLRYNHSLLPPDTQCTISTDCRLKRRLHTPGCQVIAPTEFPEKRSSAGQTEVQKRFAFHIATHHAPRQAMTVLVEDFGDSGRRSACPDYIRLLIEELKYQARTIERFDLADYRSGPVVFTPRELRNDVWGAEHFGQGLFDPSGYRPQEWITHVPDEIVVSRSPSSSSSKPRDHHQHRHRHRHRHPSASAETTNSNNNNTNGTVVVRRQPKKPLVRGNGTENRVSVSTGEVDVATKRFWDLSLRKKRSVRAGEDVQVFGAPTLLIA